MIYTCTLNTAIDLYVAVDELKPNTVNRTYDEDYQPNGKGVNVSIMLKRLGIDNVALGFIAGFSGHYIKDSLYELGIQTDFVEIDGITRINVFINSMDEYKIVNQGPMIQPNEQEQLLNKIKEIPPRSTLVVSGSLPKGVPDSIIVDIAKICYERDVKLVLDTSVGTVMETLAYKPSLLKPNEEEAASFFNKAHPLSETELIECGKELLEKGAQSVIISRGKDGALYFSHEGLLKATSPQGQVVNTACSGDTMLATFIGKEMQKHSVKDALANAVAAGASTAFSKGLSDLKDIPSLLKQVIITDYKGA
ncbi:1-phosphofructokinase [Pseudalkalibacillus sp. A8]|uniref:1-phosphofructokinase n=1 Tax=Pseudalkalibacillus sp. A8 TaxID=3382641 RepID=UPI0038B480C8